MRITRPWSTKHWCESVRKPEWPFAYSKYKGQVEETKGRVSTNEQDMRHKCETRGVQSKCHICEDIFCGADDVCHFQIQGVQYDKMSSNIPTVSDIPWAVGGNHRYDFGNASHICLHLSSECSSAFLTNYSNCQLRCWGYESGIINQMEQDTIPHTASWTRDLLTDIWEYPKMHQSNKNNMDDFIPRNPKKYGRLERNPQGYVFTLAGSSHGMEGFEDGVDVQAR